EFLQLFEPVFRHHAAGLRVDFAAPVEMGHLIGEAEFLSGRFEDPQSFRNDLVADPVALYHCNFEDGHSADSISSYAAHGTSVAYLRALRVLRGHKRLRDLGARAGAGEHAAVHAAEAGQRSTGYSGHLAGARYSRVGSSGC